jgi:outer membrane scaffolding protein for murein synthesis (MipA/OmpV family)
MQTRDSTRLRRKAVSLFAALLQAAPFGAVVTSNLQAQEEHGSDLSLQVGAASMVVPAYAGADVHRIRVVPLVEAMYREVAYIGQSKVGLDMAVGAYLLRGPRVSWMLEFGSNQARVDRRADALAGMDPSHTEGYLGTGIAYTVGPIEASAGIGFGLQSQHDVKGTLGLATGFPLAPRWLLGVGAFASLGDRGNVAAEHGVTEEEALRRRALMEAGDTRLRDGDDRAFNPRGGLKQVGARATLVHPVSERIAVLGFGEVARLRGDAADSPLTHRRTSFVAGAGIAYQIGGR